MPSEENPFPGMNPFLEHRWLGVHTVLIAYLRDALNEVLPPDLAAMAEEQLTVAVSSADDSKGRRPDAAIIEPWKEGLPPTWHLHEASAVEAEAVDEPLIFLDEPAPERWLEIREASGRLITVLELLSPTNKRDGRQDYKAKQREILASGVALVEIDLIRGGEHTVAVSQDRLPPAAGTRYIVCVARATPGWQRREVYLSGLRQRLPSIRVPLRSTDADVPLALQPLVDRCYRMGRHWLFAYDHPLDPPLPPDEEAWVRERLQAAGFAGAGVLGDRAREQRRGI